MSILGNLSKTQNDEETNIGYTTPAVLRDDKKYISMKKALVLSTILHPAVVSVIWLITFALMLLGIDLLMVKRPEPKMKDIEFVLVEKEATPINKKTPYRSDINSRAGGKHDPTRKVSMPSPKPAKTQQPKKAAPAAQKAPAKQTTPKPTPKPVQKANTAPKASPQPAKTKTAPKPAPPSVKPKTTAPAAPKVTTTPKSNFNVPVPPSANKGSLSTGPVGGSGTSQKSVGGGYAPTPSLAPTYKSSGSGTSSGSSSGSSGATGSRGGSGNYGNPGPGNPNGRPGIDTIAAPDFGPYMRDLQRRIKMNWDPPKGNESKRVVLLFKIARDGRLLSCTVSKSSGLPEADKAAINAVHLTAPFKPLPANFQGQSVDIQFTFDYNVFGGSYK